MEHGFRLERYESPKGPKPGAADDCRCVVVWHERRPSKWPPPSVREQINRHSSRYNERLTAHSNYLAASLAHPTIRRRLNWRLVDLAMSVCLSVSTQVLKLSGRNFPKSFLFLQVSRNQPDRTTITYSSHRNYRNFFLIISLVWMLFGNNIF